jgi:hypothetical protein
VTLRQAGRLLSHWRNVLLYLFVVGVFIFTVWTTGEARDRDIEQARAVAEQLRQANIRACEVGNERVIVLRDFLVAATSEPDPRQFEFIADPQLRAGALEQARRSRAEMRARTMVFVPRDCQKEWPPPSLPDDDG